MNVGQFLRQAADRTPTRVVLVDPAEPRRDVTAAELDLAARRVASRLAAASVAPGDRVALLGANSVELVAAWFGVIYAGAAVVPLPARATPGEIAGRVGHSGCRAVLHDRASWGLVSEALAAVPSSGPAAVAAAKAIAIAIAIEGAGEHVVPIPRPLSPAPGAPAMILYTSGTTTAAKGAMISHGSLLAHTMALVERELGLGPDDRVLGALPLSHSYGCRMVMLAGLASGATVVLVRRFSARGTLELMAREGVTWVPAVPTMFAAWGAVASPPAVTSVRWCLSAGAPLAEAVRTAAEGVLGAEVRQGYGLTEATFSTLNAPPQPQRAGSVGRAVWGVELRVVDERFVDVPAGERGQLLVRGQNVMAGYLEAPEATAATFHEGWVKTGDVAVLEPDGALRVVDRTKDIILRGGFTVYPAEVEEALHAHPAVAEVAVIGRPDAFYGEEVVAVMVPVGERVAVEEIAAWARERIGGDKLPREYVWTDALPLGPSRKVLKRQVREQVVCGALAMERPCLES